MSMRSEAGSGSSCRQAMSRPSWTIAAGHLTQPGRTPPRSDFVGLPFALGAGRLDEGLEILDGGVDDDFLSMDA